MSLISPSIIVGGQNHNHNHPYPFGSRTDDRPESWPPEKKITAAAAAVPRSCSLTLSRSPDCSPSSRSSGSTRSNQSCKSFPFSTYPRERRSTRPPLAKLVKPDPLLHLEDSPSDDAPNSPLSSDLATTCDGSAVVAAALPKVRSPLNSPHHLFSTTTTAGLHKGNLLLASSLSGDGSVSPASDQESTTPGGGQKRPAARFDVSNAGSPGSAAEGHLSCSLGSDSATIAALWSPSPSGCESPVQTTAASHHPNDNSSFSESSTCDSIAKPILLPVECGETSSSPIGTICDARSVDWKDDDCGKLLLVGGALSGIISRRNIVNCPTTTTTRPESIAPEESERRHARSLHFDAETPKQRRQQSQTSDVQSGGGGGADNWSSSSSSSSSSPIRDLASSDRTPMNAAVSTMRAGEMEMHPPVGGQFEISIGTVQSPLRLPVPPLLPVSAASASEPSSASVGSDPKRKRLSVKFSASPAATSGSPLRLLPSAENSEDGESRRGKPVFPEDLVVAGGLEIGRLSERWNELEGLSKSEDEEMGYDMNLVASLSFASPKSCPSSARRQARALLAESGGSEEEASLLDMLPAPAAESLPTFSPFVYAEVEAFGGDATRRAGSSVSVAASGFSFGSPTAAGAGAEPPGLLRLPLRQQPPPEGGGDYYGEDDYSHHQESSWPPARVRSSGRPSSEDDGGCSEDDGEGSRLNAEWTSDHHHRQMFFSDADAAPSPTQSSMMLFLPGISSRAQIIMEEVSSGPPPSAETTHPEDLLGNACYDENAEWTTEKVTFNLEVTTFEYEPYEWVDEEDDGSDRETNGCGAFGLPPVPMEDDSDDDGIVADPGAIFIPLLPNRRLVGGGSEAFDHVHYRSTKPPSPSSAQHRTDSPAASAAAGRGGGACDTRTPVAADAHHLVAQKMASPAGAPSSGGESRAVDHARSSGNSSVLPPAAERFFSLTASPRLLHINMEDSLPPAENRMTSGRQGADLSSSVVSQSAGTCCSCSSRRGVAADVDDPLAGSFFGQAAPFEELRKIELTSICRVEEAAAVPGGGGGRVSSSSAAIGTTTAEPAKTTTCFVPKRSGGGGFRGESSGDVRASKIIIAAPATSRFGIFASINRLFTRRTPPSRKAAKFAGSPSQRMKKGGRLNSTTTATPTAQGGRPQSRLFTGSGSSVVAPRKRKRSKQHQRGGNNNYNNNNSCQLQPDLAVIQKDSNTCCHSQAEMVVVLPAAPSAARDTTLGG